MVVYSSSSGTVTHRSLSLSIYLYLSLSIYIYSLQPRGVSVSVFVLFRTIKNPIVVQASLICCATPFLSEPSKKGPISMVGITGGVGVVVVDGEDVIVLVIAVLVDSFQIVSW